MVDQYWFRVVVARQPERKIDDEPVRKKAKIEHKTRDEKPKKDPIEPTSISRTLVLENSDSSTDDDIDVDSLLKEEREKMKKKDLEPTQMFVENDVEMKSDAKKAKKAPEQTQVFVDSDATTEDEAMEEKTPELDKTQEVQFSDEEEKTPVFDIEKTQILGDTD